MVVTALFNANEARILLIGDNRSLMLRNEGRKYDRAVEKAPQSKQKNRTLNRSNYSLASCVPIHKPLDRVVVEDRLLHRDSNYPHFLLRGRCIPAGKCRLFAWLVLLGVRRSSRRRSH